MTRDVGQDVTHGAVPLANTAVLLKQPECRILELWSGGVGATTRTVMNATKPLHDWETIAQPILEATVCKEGGGCWKGRIWLAGALVNPRSVHSLAGASADGPQLPLRQEVLVQLQGLCTSHARRMNVTGTAWYT